MFDEKKYSCQIKELLYCNKAGTAPQYVPAAYNFCTVLVHVLSRNYRQ
jgi:hypothetical protein